MLRRARPLVRLCPPAPRRCEGLLTAADGSSLPYPPHERCVEIEIDLGAGAAACTVHGSDLTKEYVSINADYRS